MQSTSSGWLKDLFTLALLIIIVVLPLRAFVISPFVVDGESMYPTFGNHDYLIIDRFSYRFSEPSRGDVIVFRYPLNPTVFYIKRIIGLPGDTVSIQHGVVTIKNENGTSLTLEEPYVATEDATYSKSVALGPDEYFVMGDNRPNSSDSRVWGTLPSANIIGRAFVRLLPTAHAGFSPGKTMYGESTSSTTSPVPTP